MFGLGFGIVGPIAASVGLTATTGDPAFVIFPLPFLGAVWALQGLAPTAFTLEARGLRIERRWLSRRIPYSAIRAVDRTARPVGGLLALGLNGIFGSHGLRWNPSTGLHYLAITNTRDLVFLHTASGLVVISPSRPDEFVAELTACVRGAGGRPGSKGAPARAGEMLHRQGEERP